MRFEDFIPEYPPLEEEDFFKRIVEKKEFWTSSSVDMMGKVLAAHQVNIARYMSQWTMYDSLLLHHEMGTGKSAVTVSMIELFRAQDSDYKKVIYISHNQTQLDNYKREIFKFSSRLNARMADLQPVQDPILDAKRRESKRNSILARDGFEFVTYGMAANELKRMTDYNHCIIILDEAHHLVLTDDQTESKKSYAAIEALVDGMSDRKLLVMTGTPIRDQPHEIVPLLNLVLPVARRLPARSEFMSTFFDVASEREVMPGIFLKMYEWKAGMRNVFQDAVRGRISYVRRETTSVEVDYVGDIHEPMKSMRLAVGVMNPADVQNEVYKEVFAKETKRVEAVVEEEEEAGGGIFRKKKKKKETSIYTQSKQASLFVFPDGSVGEEGFQKYVGTDYSLTGEFMRIFGDNMAEISALDQTTKLELLSQFSITYARLIGEVVRNPTELVYVFCDLVRGSGVLLLMAILKSLFGFKLVAGRSEIRYDRSHPRMILLNDLVTNESEFQDLIDYYNHPENRDAAFCQIILSTSKTKEGISLKNVRQIHITTPTWNMGDMSQAMARSLRAKSHADLVDPKVRIFLHCATPFFPQNEAEEALEEPGRVVTEKELRASVDFQRYYRSEIKERNAKLIERVFLESSWDCAMNMPVNSSTGRLVDYSRECEYDTCRYQCEGMEGNIEEIRGRDRVNFDMLYSGTLSDQILLAIRGVFRRQDLCTMADIMDAVREVPDVDRILVEKCLVTIITEPIALLDARRLPRFLMSTGDVFFLADNPTMTSPASYYYQKNPATVVDFPMEEVLDGFYFTNMRTLVPRLIRVLYTKNPNAVAFFQSFPLEFQREFCEITIQNEILHPDRFKRFSYRQWFVDSFRTEITLIPNVLMDHHFVSEKKQHRRLDLQRPRDGWKTIVVNDTIPS
jgi:hypothetical protein